MNPIIRRLCLIAVAVVIGPLLYLFAAGVLVRNLVRQRATKP